MKAEDFYGSPSGTAVRTIQGYTAFMPDPLPPPIDFGPLLSHFGKASISIGELNGIGRTLPNPYILQRPFLRREAVSSSAIEGTVTTLSDLFSYEAGADSERASGDTREVHNYVRALEQSFEALNNWPISGRLIKQAHTTLLEGLSVERGAKNRPGEYRKHEPAWTGSRLVHDARFVFAPPDKIEDCMADLERFIAAENNIPPLIKAALIHYQFETIHPFHDGNGRVGRLLVPLYLCSERLLPQPLLFLSPYFERNRDEYIRLLYDVSHVGSWIDWVGFFLKGVAEQAKDFIFRSKKIIDLQQEYKRALTQARASALLMRLVDMICERPILSIPNAAKTLDVTYNSAKKNIDKLVDKKIVQPFPNDTSPKLFIANKIFDLIYNPIDEIEETPTV